MEAKEREAIYYESPIGKQPFGDWRRGLRDSRTKAAVDARIARIRAGNFGDSKSVGNGVSESRIDFGPGYRLYYAVDGEKVILLCGGDKRSQNSDIASAKAFWAEYKGRELSKGVGRDE